MKTQYAILTMTAMATSFIAAADAGIVHYSFEADKTVASVGDTINITVRVDIDPQDSPFVALAGAAFDIHVIDPAVGGGVIDNTPPQLGLTSDFANGGNQGTLAGSSILDILAFQFPPFMGGPVNTDTELDLYNFTYTITEADQRAIMLSIEVDNTQVYMNQIQPMHYDSTTTPMIIEVMSLPTPGALALLGMAGIVGFRRRRAI